MRKLKKIFISTLVGMTFISPLCGCNSNNDSNNQVTNSNSGITNSTNNNEDVINYESLNLVLNSTSDAYTVKSADSNATEVIIPEKYNNLPVTSIGIMAFSKCKSLKKITIPDSVTEIGLLAFANCKVEEATVPAFACDSIKNENLKKLTITSGEELLYSLSKCTSLTSITIPDSMKRINCVFWDCPIEEATIPALAYQCFSAKKTLKKVTITSGEEIPEDAFNEYTALESVTLPNNLITIGKCAFVRCKSLTKIILPNSVKNIGTAAFQGCESLEEINIPDSVETIGNDVFGSCYSLKYNEYDNAYYLGNDNNPYLLLMKEKSRDITSCIINDKCKIFHYTVYDGSRQNAFLHCNSLQFNEYENGLYLGSDDNPYFVLIREKYSNKNCEINSNCKIICRMISDSQTSLNIPENVIFIEYGAIDCENITSITVDENNKYYDSRDNSNAIIRKSNNELIRGCINTLIPNSVEIISEYSFTGCEELTSLTIPHSIKYIGMPAFDDLDNSFNDITYDGTKEEWENLINALFRSDLDGKVVHCSDMDIKYEYGETIYINK